MIKKHKQLIIGFILGAFIFGIVPVSAAVQEYVLQKSTAKFIVDGKEFANKDLPMLNYKGYNYIPAATFREISEGLGIGFEWVGEKNEIQISTMKEPIETNEFQQPSIQEEVITKTDDENIILINGVKYISQEGINEYLRGVNKDKKLNEGYYMSPFKDYTSKVYTIQDGEITVIIDSVPMKRVYGDKFYNSSEQFVEYSFFENTIIPLTK